MRSRWITSRGAGLRTTGKAAVARKGGGYNAREVVVGGGQGGKEEAKGGGDLRWKGVHVPPAGAGTKPSSLMVSTWVAPVTEYCSVRSWWPDTSAPTGQEGGGVPKKIVLAWLPRVMKAMVVNSSKPLKKANPPQPFYKPVQPMHRVHHDLRPLYISGFLVPKNDLRLFGSFGTLQKNNGLCHPVHQIPNTPGVSTEWLGGIARGPGAEVSPQGREEGGPRDPLEGRGRAAHFLA